jgi:SNF2 family DNA or RNA helicase
LSLYDQLWPYQKEAYNFSIQTPGNHVALFCEQGTGKTWIGTALLERTKDLCDDKQFSGLLVAPLSTIQAKDGWRFVFKKAHIRFYTDLESFKAAKSHRVLLINWESFGGRRKKAGRPTPPSKKLSQYIARHKWHFGCFDESQKMKARNSKASRLAGRIKKCDFRLLLSGTPFDDLLEDPQEVWAQWRFLNPKLFGTRWANFDHRYLRKTGWMNKKRKFRGRKTQERVLKMIAPNTLRVTKKVLGLKPPRYIWCGVSMLGKQRELYDRMDETSVIHTDIDGEHVIVTAELTITKLVKLQQICGGFIKDDDDEIHDIGRAKLRKLKYLVKKAGYPVVIYAKYIYEVNQIVQELSSGNVSIRSIIGKTRRMRGETIDEFQRGKVDVLVAQVRTGGVGINLQRAHIAIFYSTTFSYIDFDQAVSRLHRAGQKRQVKIFLLFCKSSVDKSIYEVIISKRNVSEKILNRYQP